MAAPMIGTSTPSEAPERSGEEVARGVPGVVRMLMALNGIASKDVAAYLHLHPNRMSERMTGKKPFTLAQTVDLARYFDVSIETMLRDPAEVRERVQNWK